MRPRLVLVLLLVLTCVTCNRNIEPYVEGEEPREPNLARIFPEGADAPGPGLRGSGAAGNLPAPPSDRPAAASAPGAEIQGTLEISDELAGRGPAQATLFLIARREGSTAGPPLAVVRIPSPTLPMPFTIGPQNVLIQGMPFTGAIRLTARLDGDGDPMTRQPGDLSGTAAQASAPGERGIRIVFDQQI